MFAAKKKIEWRFILERAPWFGGFYERIVQTLKSCLRKILRNARLTYEELVTVITEIEGTINSRPLTYLSSDDLEEPITPAHLVLGRRILTFPCREEFDSDNDEATTGDVQRRANYLRVLLGHYWRRWSHEYLLNLREFHRFKELNKGQKSIEIGDIVIVKEPNMIRGQWKIAVVEELIPSADEEVRGATVRVVNSKGKLTYLRRPVKVLFPLEVNEVVNEQRDIVPVIAKNNPADVSVRNERPPRRAAAANADLIRTLVDQA